MLLILMMSVSFVEEAKQGNEDFTVILKSFCPFPLALLFSISNFTNHLSKYIYLM